MGLLADLAAAVRAHPLAFVALTHGASGLALLWALSGGRPLSLAYKLLFKGALAVVPRALREAEQAKQRRGLERSVIGSSLDGEQRFEQLPGAGLPKAEVVALLERYAGRDAEHWRSGQLSGAVYHGGDALTDVMAEAFRRFALSNPLHPDVFPMVRKMEAECVSMALRLFHGDAARGACGSMTSGGTESILMAVKAYRDLARTERGVTEPELVVPVTAHAAFDKACHYFGVKLVHVAVDARSFRADVAAMCAAVNANTIALVASAPSYPQGVVDPVEELAAFARKRDLPLHVDCCLGSFCIAFAASAGFPVSRGFDFAVEGVTSISCDTHKYGFAPKGSSVIMYARRAFRDAQYFVAPEWTGGIYASPSIAGSRPGALIAACWATMLSVGSDGYRDAARAILSAARRVADGVRAMPLLALLGEPDLSVVCFSVAKGSGLNIYAVKDALAARGWNLNTMQNPACVHLCVTYANHASADRFVEDLAWAVATVRAAPAGTAQGESAAMYGLAASIPDKSLIANVAMGYLDALTACPPAAAE
jgi:sphinganine-1-phosphate aldolase